METPDINNLKSVHDIYCTTVQILEQRVKFFVEEFEAVDKMVKFYKLQIEELRKQIEQLEPKKED